MRDTRWDTRTFGEAFKLGEEEKSKTPGLGVKMAYAESPLLISYKRGSL